MPPFWTPNIRNDERQQAEDIAAAYPSLFLKAQQLARTINTGLHGRRKHGKGEDFWQFKPYTQSDSAARIDWRQTAKRGDAHVRQNELETTESIWFWIDKSPSMAYRSHLSETPKRENITIALLAMAILLNRGEEDFAILTNGMKAAHGNHHLDGFSRQLSTPAPSDFSDDMASTRLPEKSRLLVASDFLSPPEALEKTLGIATAKGVTGILLHVADPAEVTLPFTGRTRFADISEQVEITLGRPENIQQEYQTLFNTHQQAIETIAKNAGWSYIFHQSDQSLIHLLTVLYRHLHGRG